MLDFQKESLKYRNQIEIKQLEIKGLILENSVDMDQFKVKLGEIASFQVELEIKAFETQLKIKEVLTEEQLAKFPIGFSIQRSGKRDFSFSLRNKQGR